MSSRWIALRLKMIGKRQVELAHETGLDPSAVSKLIKGERRLATDEISGIARALQVTDEILLRAFHADDNEVDQFADLPQQASRLVVDSKTTLLPHLIPIRSGSCVGAGDDIVLADGPVGYTTRPPSLTGVKDAYALYAVDDAMSPRYEVGWLLFVNPFKPPRAGRDVVVEKSDGTALIRQFMGRAGGKVVLQSINPASKAIELAEREIRHIHVITGCDQES